MSCFQFSKNCALGSSCAGYPQLSIPYPSVLPHLVSLQDTNLLSHQQGFSSPSDWPMEIPADGQRREGSEMRAPIPVKSLQVRGVSPDLFFMPFSLLVLLTEVVTF